MDYNRSIDGLRRRTPTKPLGVSNLEQKSANNIWKEKKPDTYKVQETTPKERLQSEDKRDRAISEFLNDVKDGDPKSLLGVEELPRKQKTKKERKRRHVSKVGGQKKKKSKKKKIILVIVGILLAAIIGVVIWVYLFGNSLISRVTGGGDIWSVITSDPDTPLASDSKTGRTNVLIFGTEGYSMDDPRYDGGFLTDTIMLASLNQETGEISTISLPRDLKAKTCFASSKINEVYLCTYQSNNGTAESRAEYEKLAARSLADQLEEVLGLEIQYFVHANWQAVVQLVDTLGGIDVAFVYQGTSWTGKEVAIETTDKRGLADYWDAKTRTYGIKFDNDKVYHLDGAQALGVARSRNQATGYGASGGNFSREQFQQKILQALILKAKETNFASDFVAALGVLNAIGDNIRTDFKDTEMKTLLKIAGRIDLGNMESISIQETDDGTALLTSGMLPASNGQMLSYVYPVAGVGNYSEIHDYLARRFSPDPIIAENASIIVMNANGTSGLATSEASRLKEIDYRVIKATDAPSSLAETKGIAIYQFNSHKNKTADALNKLYKDSTMSSNVPESLTGLDCDFVIILGDGYEGF